MLPLIAKRLAAAVVIVLALSAVVFILQKLYPDRPGARLPRRQRPPTAAIAHEEHKLGYDRPLVVQYVSYVSGLLHGNWTCR